MPSLSTPEPPVRASEQPIARKFTDFTAFLYFYLVKSLERGEILV